MNLSRRSQVIVGAALLLGATTAVGFTVGAISSAGGNPPSAHAIRNTRTPSTTGTTNVHLVRTDVVDNVTWELSVGNAGDGTQCVTVSAATSTDSGSLGGCGTSSGDFPRLGQGGIRIGQSWYNVAYGLVPSGATQVQVDLANSTTLVGEVSDGGWYVTTSGDNPSDTPDFRTVEALAADSAVVAHTTLPSLSAYRRAATNAKAGDR
jgi:hypothetical protein